MIVLIAESGYMAIPEVITEDAIESHLRANPDLVPQWAQYSEDQRCTPAHYLWLPDGIDTRPGSCIVGYIETGGRESQKKRFKSPFAACASYIKRESEMLRTHAEKAS